MSLLLDPNVAYFLLAFGSLFAILALFTPGTGILEIGAVLTLILAGYSLLNLPINYWALGLLVIGVVLIVMALRRPKQYVYLAAAIAFIIMGTLFAFRGNDGLFAINPALAIVVSVVNVSLLWFIGRRSIEAMRHQPVFDLDRLIGQTATAEHDIHHQGELQIDGEAWSVRSKLPIPAGSEVVVIGREGLTLRVEQVEPEVDNIGRGEFNG